MKETPLRFWDHARQSFSKLPIPTEAEFMVGDYGDGLGSLGEFKIALHRFRGEATLSAQVCVFSDAHGSLMEFIRLGGLQALEDCANQDILARQLIALGIQDVSAMPLTKAPAA